MSYEVAKSKVRLKAIYCFWKDDRMPVVRLASHQMEKLPMPVRTSWHLPIHPFSNSLEYVFYTVVERMENSR